MIHDTHPRYLAREPAQGLEVILELRQASEWVPISRGTSDENGRISTLTDGPLTPGTYQLTFDTGAFHRDQGLSVAFFPEVKITFNVRDPDEQLPRAAVAQPVRYSTYRGT